MITPPLVYLAGPYSAPTWPEVDANISRAICVAVEIARVGAFPVTPHALTADAEFEELQSYEFYLAATLAICRTCDAIFLLPDWDTSRGAREEAKEMQKLGRPIFYDVADVAEWVKARAAA